jgi:CBS domain-containing protein
MNIVQMLQEETLDRLDLTGYAQTDPATTVGEVLKIMRELRVSAVLVAEEGRLVGIFTERDVLTKVADAPSTWDRPVVDFMTRDPQVLSAQQPISEALQLMNAGHYRNVPVLDAEGRIEGNLPQHEVIRFLTDQFPQDIYNLPPDPDRIAHTKEGA